MSDENQNSTDGEELYSGNNTVQLGQAKGISKQLSQTLPTKTVKQYAMQYQYAT